jgi:hypothetical protein
MSIASEITRIKGKVADSFTACAAKGATIPESEVIANLPDCIASIPTGSQAVLGTKTITANGTYNAVDDELDGYSAVTVAVEGTEEPTTGFRVRFFDYDGTLLKTQYVESGEDATPPTLPTHSQFTFQGWNGSYENVTEKRDLTPHYTRTDGKILVTVKVTSLTGLTVRLNYHNSSLCSIAWGDGQTSTGGSINASHTYASAGIYDILITPDSTLPFKLGTTTTNHAFIGETTNQATTNSALLKIELGGNVSLERNYLFYQCDSFTTMNIPLIATSFGTNWQARYLKWFAPPLAVTDFPPAFYNNYSLKSYVIPENITSIGENAFRTCLFLEEITLPNGLTSIGNSAFQGCNSLSEITLPSGLLSLGSSAFRQCYNLEEITLPSGIATIEAYTFYNCYNLKKIVIEKTDALVTLAATDAFSSTNADLKIYVPDALVNDYKTETNWNIYADYIVGHSEL